MIAAIGLDIGATKTLGVVDARGVVGASVRRPTAAGAEGVLATATELVEPVAAVGAALLGRSTGPAR
jgi:glucokinase